MTKKSIQFVFANPSNQDAPAPESGKITLTVESGSESAHDILNDLDFEQELEKFLQNSFCAENGRVVPLTVAKTLATIK